MAEKLFQKLEKCNERVEVKIMIMNLLSRLIGIHQVNESVSINFLVEVKLIL